MDSIDLNALYLAQAIEISKENQKELSIFFDKMKDKDVTSQITEYKKLRDFLRSLNRIN